jgi:hypothetical protein
VAGFGNIVLYDRNILFLAQYLIDAHANYFFQFQFSHVEIALRL